MVLLSNGGENTFRSTSETTRLVVGTVDGIFVLERAANAWRLATRALEGCSVSAVTSLASGTLLAATHGLGVARSVDNGQSWEWSNQGLPQFDLWAARGGLLRGQDVALVGSMPAHLMMSDDDGRSWRELPALRQVPSCVHWTFPPPPRLGHVKDIVLSGDKLYVGIEIGALLVSDDMGRTFTDLRVDPDPRECDVHRLLVDPRSPERMIAAIGLVGLVRSIDGGATWTRDPMLPTMEYPDAFLMHPDQSGLLFLAAGVGWPPHWYKAGRAQGKLARSRDGGKTWERLLGGLPDGQRALFSALSVSVHDGGFDLFAADTDGQVFESRDEGDHWTIIADIAAVSKGEFHRALAKGRPRLAGVDDMVVNAAAEARFKVVG
ncbi:photosystem II stability/assembly factor-like uncharacterized protein [Bradyrhizobium sp. GM22.5]